MHTNGSAALGVLLLLGPLTGGGAAACGRLLAGRVERGALAEADFLLGATLGGLELHGCFDFFAHCLEGVVDVGGALRRCLNEGNFEMFGQLQALLVRHFAFVFEVHFIADEDFVHARVGEALDLMHPLAHVVKGLAVGHVVDDDDALCAAVVAGGERAEALLTCGVPNLKFDDLVV